MFKLFKRQYQESLFKTENDEFWSKIEANKIEGNEIFAKIKEKNKSIKANTKAIRETQQQINKLMCFNTK